jgi:protein-tyrosine phosphatase
VVHCRGGLGRTGTVAACVLVADEQEDFVRHFGEALGKGVVS